MPYIPKDHRETIDDAIKALRLTMFDSNPRGNRDGVLNYAISTLVANCIDPLGEWRYSDICRAMGTFECAKQEFYDRIGRTREDQAIEKNGDIEAYEEVQ